jgi:hypothetical protein
MPEMALMRRTNAASFGPVPGPYRTFVWRPTISEFVPEQTCGKAQLNHAIENNVSQSRGRPNAREF